MPMDIEWKFSPNCDRTEVTFLEIGLYSLFRRHIESGVFSNKELAEALKVPPYNISRLAAQGEKDGWLVKDKKGCYKLSKSAQQQGSDGDVFLK